MHVKQVVAAAISVGMLLSLPHAFAAKQTEKKSAKVSKAAEETVVTVKPPSGQWEGKPPPADGWVWSAGYHEWKDGRFQWKPGEWILDKPGQDYRQHQWVEAGEGKWKLIGGDWMPEKQASAK